MIPKTMNDVTADWLGEVLGTDVSAIRFEQIGQGVGLMGDIFRVELDAAEGAPASVVVKLPSSFEENRTQGVALGMFAAEVQFYNELAGEVPAGLPSIYHADFDPETSDFVIVMEDLSNLSMVSQAQGMTTEQAMAAVSVLGQIHAVWWDQVKAPRFEWIPTMDGPRISYVDELLTQIYPVFADGFADVLPAGGLELFEKFCGNYLAINSVLAARSPWTLNHQDYRVENLMFGPPGSGQVVVLDWQGIGLGPGAYDLAYVLSGSMETEPRREAEPDLLAAYHGALTAGGVSGFPLDQLWEDYRHAQLMGGLATSVVTGGTLDLSNERGRELVATMARRHVTAALDHDGHARIDAVIAGK